jgi:hypothetical protein
VYLKRVGNININNVIAGNGGKGGEKEANRSKF